MPMGPGGMTQSGPPPQPPHGHNMPSEGMVSVGPPAPHMQSQMNGQMPGKSLTQYVLLCLSFFFFFLSQFLSCSGCLATPQNQEGGLLLKDDVIRWGAVMALNLILTWYLFCFLFKHKSIHKSKKYTRVYILLELFFWVKFNRFYWGSSHSPKNYSTIFLYEFDAVNI